MTIILKIKYRLSIFLLSIISIVSCNSDDKKNIPDVSNVASDVKIIRFEKELFALNQIKKEDSLTIGIRNLEAKYPSVCNEFFLNIINAKKPNEAPSAYYPLVNRFITDTFVCFTADTAQMVFNNFEPIKKELEQAGKFYKYYFPKANDLTFLTFVSQYNYDVFPFGKDSIGIGLDFFLGENHADYKNIENLRYDYVRRTLTKEHLVARAFRLQIANMAGEPTGAKMLDLMIHNGKQLYILDQILPLTPDSIKFSYTGKQTNWCKDNESGIWASILKSNVLYESNGKKIGKLISPSPNSPGMPPEAPGETANFIGWQIIKQYMKRNPETTLSQLLSLRDAQQILDKSKYKPAK